jgi:3-dehydroquinate synthase
VNKVVVPVALADRSYHIHIGSGLMAQAGEMIQPLLTQPRVIIVTDEQVAPHYLKMLETSLGASGIRHDAVIVPAGEGSKSFAEFERLMNKLLALQPDRKLTLIALGGGVVGDLCGFAASVLLRGVEFIQIPTTLLAQVDSSVGGKTGINAPAGKNLIGSFHQPRLVLIDIDTLKTLPDREMKAGYAEIVKYGLIGDRAFFEWLEQYGGDVLLRAPAALTHAIEVSCRAKAAIVAADEREGNQRALLNLGHTFGHALEAETGFSDRLLHGEAVAIGMVMAARLSHQLGMCGQEVESRLVEHLRALAIPASPRDIQTKWSADALCHHFYADKKAEGGTLTFILLKSIGEGIVVKNVDPIPARQVVMEMI